MLKNVEEPKSSQNVPMSLSEWDPAIGDGEKALQGEPQPKSLLRDEVRCSLYKYEDFSLTKKKKKSDFSKYTKTRFYGHIASFPLKAQKEPVQIWGLET